MICLFAGARPNFMKIAPLYHEFRSRDTEVLWCHTGQHKDYMMSDNFISEFNLPDPNFYGIENVKDVSLAIVVGDVDSSLQAARWAFNLGIPIAHVEAGLRSFDNEMPEERNRIEIDKLSTYLFVTEPSGVENLKAEGITENVFLVGNVMIDTLKDSFPRQILLTIHRPSNHERIGKILDMMESLGISVIYPAHPRIKIDDYNRNIYKNVFIINPLTHSQLITILLASSLVVTDSGGIQEEASYLGRNCITLRANTERPLTLQYGNQIVYDLDEAKKLIQSKLNIPLWDGKAAERIVDCLEQFYI